MADSAQDFFNKSQQTVTHRVSSIIDHRKFSGVKKKKWQALLQFIQKIKFIVNL
jgi:predicted SprT family Zn-dependent metalloprotease